MTTPIPAEHEGAPVTADTMSEVLTPAPAGRPPDDTVVAAGTAETPAGSAVAERDYQKAYLLRQLEEAHGGRLTKGKANRFPRLVQRELNLIPTTANALRDELIQEGFVSTARKGGSITYELTDAGRVHLATLPQKALSADGGETVEAEVTEEVRQFRRSFLLFQLFESEGQALEQKVINRFREPGRKFLDLRAPVANEFRKVLEQEGLIEVDRQGKNATYRLTAAGREELGATAHFPDIELTLQGRVLNELLEAARDSAKQFEAPAVDAVAEEQPVPG